MRFTSETGRSCFVPSQNMNTEKNKLMDGKLVFFASILNCFTQNLAIMNHVILIKLRFYGPVNPLGSCQAWSVYLTKCLLGRLSPLISLPVLCTFFSQKLTTALLESVERRE